MNGLIDGRMFGWMDGWLFGWMGRMSFRGREPSGLQTPRRGLALGVKPKVRTINPPLALWAVEPRNTRLLWEDISVQVALANIQM